MDISAADGGAEDKGLAITFEFWYGFCSRDWLPLSLWDICGLLGSTTGSTYLNGESLRAELENLDIGRSFPANEWSGSESSIGLASVDADKSELHFGA